MAREIVTLAVMGMDQHENGIVAVVRILREAQMQVVYTGCFQTPASVAAAAVRDSAQVIGISCHSWEYLKLVPRLLDELRQRGLDIPVVIGGSVITAADAERMSEAGVARVFPASAREAEIVDAIRELAARKPQPSHQGYTP